MKWFDIGFVALCGAAVHIEAFSLPTQTLEVSSRSGRLPTTSRLAAPPAHYRRKDTFLKSHSELSEVLGSTPWLSTLATSPLLWTALVMGSIVALLYSWEEAVHITRKKLPKTLMPVLDSMLAEMGGLGFVGLFLGVFVTGGPLGAVVEDLSEEFLGDGEILIETFEFLHTAFFEVAIAFFLISGIVVNRLINQIKYLEEFSLAVFDMDKDGKVGLRELADFLDVKCVPVDRNADGVIEAEEVTNALRSIPKDPLSSEVFLSSDGIRAEALVVRHRFLETCSFQPEFKIEDYIVPFFGKKLQELVELSPLVWLPLIPALSFGRAVDMSHDVVSSASVNAYESCGSFLSDPLFFPSSLLVAVTGLTWSVFNFWKVSSIKQMLLPLLVRDETTLGKRAALLPPRYQDPVLLKEFNSSPSLAGWIESFFAEPAKNDHEKLFGVAGHAGPELYLNSIKFNSWFVVSQIVFWGSQIVYRDARALLEGWAVSNIELVQTELLVFGAMVALCFGQLALSPQTFLNYCLITSIESLADDQLLDNMGGTNSRTPGELHSEIGKKAILSS